MKPPWEITQPLWKRPLLMLAEAGYALGLGAKRFPYKIGLQRGHRMSVPVICVGNITVGGTGKTPAVIAICRRLREWGHSPAVISRGYRGEKGDNEIIRVDPVESDWKRVGDEPLLIARSLPDVPVYVGVDRVAAAKRATEEAMPTVIVLDDGFQHWRLARKMDIVLLDGTNPFGNGKLLPRGPLREPLAALHRASLIALTKVNLAEEGGVWAQRLQARLRAPVVQAIHRPSGFFDLSIGQVRPLSDVRNTSVVAASGLARNETFTDLLRSIGAKIEGALDFSDHQEYGPVEWAEIRHIMSECNTKTLVTTAKDATKWSAEDIRGMHVWVLEIAFEVSIGAERFWNAVRQAVEG